MKSTIVMTGANRGIGRVAAELILDGSPDTHLVVVARGNAGARVAEELGPDSVSHVAVDLASLASVRSGAEEIGRRLDAGELPPLAGFVGNAGIQHTNALTETEDGFESTFAVNVLANHLFVRLLQNRFTVPARIVLTVSDTHFGDFRHNLGMVPGPEWHSPDSLSRTAAFAKPATTAAGRTAYSTSKLAAIYLVHEYARRLPTGVEAIAFNPGFVPGTDLARHADPFSRFAMRRVLPALTLTPLAATRAAAGRNLAGVVLGDIPAPTGSYVDRDRPAPSSGESYDPQREAEIWSTAEQLIAAYAA
ncbi:SDR family NAD(P)-dependent oxidoreductase [Nocardia jejuensis]|uniref:SDR family NAD(P)-dependent oxidoreductase n=1 Tax=Nocardia jejuensis TaxID=328049 RepID=UPI00082F0293|nr:SDR family NAD(P)-dependent oxidoreductase [Nocardia jejuensis]